MLAHTHADEDKGERTKRTRTRTGSQSRSGRGRKPGHQQHDHRHHRHPSVNQAAPSVLCPALSPRLFHSTRAPPGRCGTDPARFKLSLFPDRHHHQVTSRQTAAVETKTHDTHDTHDAAHRAPSLPVLLPSLGPSCTRHSSHPHIASHITDTETRTHARTHAQAAILHDSLDGIDTTARQSCLSLSAIHPSLPAGPSI